MDQEPLVSEQIEAGKRFIDEFDKHVPVRAAFWLKATEDSGWYLYVASDRITDENTRTTYAKVGQLAKKINDPNLDMFRVKLIGTKNPYARDVLARYKRLRAAVPIRITSGQFGEMSVEGAYLYPPPASAAVK
jgi:hypothetical protein